MCCFIFRSPRLGFGSLLFYWAWKSKGEESKSQEEKSENVRIVKIENYFHHLGLPATYLRRDAPWDYKFLMENPRATFVVEIRRLKAISAVWDAGALVACGLWRFAYTLYRFLRNLSDKHWRFIVHPFKGEFASDVDWWSFMIESQLEVTLSTLIAIVWNKSSIVIHLRMHPSPKCCSDLSHVSGFYDKKSKQFGSKTTYGLSNRIISIYQNNILGFMAS